VSSHNETHYSITVVECINTVQCARSSEILIFAAGASISEIDTKQPKMRPS
jgi:hypothetical protein